MDIKELTQKIENGLILQNSCLFNASFINKYLDILNIQERRYYINQLKENNYSLYEKVNSIIFKEYDKIFNDGFDEYIEKYKKFIKLDDNKIKEILSSKLYEIFMDRYFEDFPYNIIINIQSMLEFNKKVSILDEERVQLYQSILNFKAFSLENEKDIYLNMPKDIGSYLYEDFRKCQNYAYNLINKEIINIQNLGCKQVNGVNVYYLDGENFIMPVHVPKYKRDENISWNETFEEKTLSVSLIGNHFLGTYRNPYEYILLGFNHININDIMHIYHTDSFTKGEKLTDKVNELYIPEELLKKTKGFNEILIAQNSQNKKLKPSCVVCYDNFTENDLRNAKTLDIPILLINTKKYHTVSNFLEFGGNSYIKNMQDLFTHNKKSQIFRLNSVF